MLALFDRIKKVAASDANVLIHGDPGLGIECIALMLHQNSRRSNEAFLARSCTAIPSEYFTSEMFGHRHAFLSTADDTNNGAFVEADHGTLFLDEIGDLSYGPQTELFRAINEKSIRPVGDEQEVRANPRIICASAKDLRASASHSAFRDDLFYCLATVELTILPLRAQRDVIIPFAHHFGERAVSWPCTFTTEAETRLLAYDWPGNIRELRSTIEHAAIHAGGSKIQCDDLAFAPSVRMDGSSCLLADVERRHILSVIKSCRGNKTDAAKVLGLARSTLVLKLRTISAA